MNYRWYSFGVMIGRRRLAEGVVAPWTQTEAERQVVPTVTSAAVRETEERPGRGAHKNVVKGGFVIQPSHVTTRRSNVCHPRHRINRKRDPLSLEVTTPESKRLIRCCRPYARKPASQTVLRAMQLTVHATRRTPHGASLLVLAMFAWSVKTRRTPSRHRKDARICGHTTTAMHDNEYIPSASLVCWPHVVNRARFHALDRQRHEQTGPRPAPRASDICPLRDTPTISEDLYLGVHKASERWRDTFLKHCSGKPAHVIRAVSQRIPVFAEQKVVEGYCIA